MSMPTRTNADLHLIAGLVKKDLMYEDRAAMGLIKEKNPDLAALLAELEIKDKAKFFLEQAFPTYQEATLIINDKNRQIRLLTEWRNDEILKGDYAEARYYQSQIRVWKESRAIWSDIKGAAKHGFDAIWKLGIAATFPGDESKKDSGSLGAFGGYGKLLVKKLQEAGTKKPSEKAEEPVGDDTAGTD